MDARLQKAVVLAAVERQRRDGLERGFYIPCHERTVIATVLDELGLSGVDIYGATMRQLIERVRSLRMTVRAKRRRRTLCQTRTR